MSVDPLDRVLIEPPDSDIAVHLRQLAHDACPAHVAAHCERSFQFAALLADADGADVDMEVLFVGTILHDLGLSSRYAGSQRFEVRGAAVARTLLREADWSPTRADNVWDIIALHTTSGIAAAKSPETRYANLGISLDVGGRGADALAPAILRAVLDRWPRTTFPAEFAATIIDEVRTNPDATRSTWMEHIAVAMVPGYTAFDFIARLRQSDSFC